MELSLTHVGEPLFAAMADRQRRRFVELCGLKDVADMAFISGAPALAVCRARLAPFAGRAFDGWSRVDVVWRIRADLAVAFELKLGLTGMGKSRVDGEWLKPCEPSHGGTRWKGSMMAILDRRFAQSPTGDLSVLLDGQHVQLAREWFVLARRQTLASWSASPPDFGGHMRTLAFETAVDCFGGGEEFNGLVRELLVGDYYQEWNLGS